MKKWMLLGLLLLCGCARESAPVGTLALDRAGDAFRLTAALVRQDTPDGTAAATYLTVSADTPEMLLPQLTRLAGSTVDLPSAQVLLLGESAADALPQLTKLLCDTDGLRLSLRIALVRDGDARALLAAQTDPFALATLLDHAADCGYLPDMPLYRAADALAADGTLILPALRLQQTQTMPAGTAVFQNGVLRCYLDGNGGVPDA